MPNQELKNIISSLKQDPLEIYPLIGKDFKKSPKVAQIVAIALNSQFNGRTRLTHIEINSDNLKCLAYLDYNKRISFKLAINILKNFPSAQEHLPKKILESQEFFLEQIASNSNDIFENHAIKDLLKNDRSFLLKAIILNPLTFNHLNSELRLELSQDQAFMIKLLEKDHELYQCLSPELKKDKKFILKAIKKNPYIIFRCYDEFQINFNILATALSYDRSGKIESFIQEQNHHLLTEIKYILCKKLLGIEEKGLIKERNLISFLSPSKTFKLPSELNKIIAEFAGYDVMGETMLLAARKLGLGTSITEMISSCKDLKSTLQNIVYESPDLFNSLLNENKIDRQLIFAAGIRAPFMLSNIPEDILVNDMNLMLALINNNIECILYAPNKLKNNPVFIQKVMGIDASLLEYATDELRSNPKFIQEMMGINASLLEDSMNDIEEKRESNKTDLKLLKYATKELAIKLVMHDGDYLKYLSDELRANYDIVLAAVKNNGISIKHAPKILRQQTNIASEAIKQNGHAVKYIPPELLTYETLVLEAIKTNRDALKYSESLQSDKKFLLKALAMSPNIILNIDRELLNDRDFMLKAFKINPNIVKIKPYCIDIIFSDETFKNYFNCLGDEKTIDLLAGRADLISLHDKKDNKDFILQVLDQTVWILQYVQNEILTDPEIIAKAPSFATEILLSKKLINNESPQSVMDQEIVGFSQVAPRKAFRPTPKTTINSRLVKDILQGNRADNQGREIYRG